MRLPHVLTGMDDDAITTSKKRMKFLCSHGGKILPRPADAQLRYVGGETRIISVPMDISFQQLMKKLRCLSKGEMVLKYQVISEDLDALVSVKCEEDVGHMFDEINNWENAGGSMLRSFLFPTNPVMMENQMAVDPLLLEQRYVDAINGIIRSASRQHPNIIRHGSSSPSSPESCTTEVTYTENYHKSNMHRVQSLPNICTNAAQQHIIRKPALHLQRTEKVRSVGPRYHLDAAPLHYYSHASKKNRGMDL